MWGTSRDKQYRCVIVGGGPAGLAVLIRAQRLGVMNEICESVTKLSNGTQVGGTCIIDGGAEDRFGGGRLQDYEINSNTDADAFVTNIIGDKPSQLPPESATGTDLELLKSSDAANSLEEAGQEPAPLPLVGEWLREVAFNLKSSLHKYRRSNIIHSTWVESIERVLCPSYNSSSSSPHSPHSHSHGPGRESPAESADSSLLTDGGSTTSEDQDQESKDDKSKTSGQNALYCDTGSDDEKMSSYWVLRCRTRDNEAYSVFAQNIVMATGGSQKLPSSPPPSSFYNSQHLAKMVTSDTFITSEGISAAVSKLWSCKNKRVVIIGGSHSAF